MISEERTRLKREEKIMKLLLKSDELSTSKIAVKTGISYYITEDILKALHKDSVIKKRINGKNTYWRKKTSKL